MLTEAEFKQWSSNLGFPEPTIELIKRIRDSESSRNVGGGKKNVVGAYPSRKMGKAIQFESHKVELPGLYIKEHDDSVLELYDQPPQIKISFKSRKERVATIYHTPDYFVLYDNEAGWEEWKTEEELIKLSNDYPSRYILINGKWHCPPGEEYANQFGLHYWVKSSSEINWLLQRNINFLEDYLMDTETNIPTEVTRTILTYVRSNPGILLLDLLESSGVEVSDIYYLLTRGKIYINLEQELLAEPQYTRVFIDEQTSLAYKTLAGSKNVPKIVDQTIEVAPGTKITWDGKPWVIVNLGDKFISIYHDDTGIIDIAKEQFFNLICENRIQGVDNEIIKSVNSIINSKLAEASENDIKEANRRYNIILPVLNGSKIEDIYMAGGDAKDCKRLGK